MIMFGVAASYSVISQALVCDSVIHDIGQHTVQVITKTYHGMIDML